MMKKNTLIKGLLVIAALMGYVHLFSQKDTGSFDRQSLYTALSSNSTAKIDQQLALVKQTNLTEKNAFEGALLMKKSGMISGPGKKLSMFKEGSEKLEKAISNDSENAEYRFLRLMIQENAPSLLGYNDDIKTDSELVRRSYKKLPQDVQHAVVNYSKTSKSLRISDL